MALSDYRIKFKTSDNEGNKTNSKAVINTFIDGLSIICNVCSYTNDNNGNITLRILSCNSIKFIKGFIEDAIDITDFEYTAV